jgi:outer membrane protein X
MKKLIFGLLLCFFVVSLNAQERGKIRVGGNLGLAVPTAGFGGSIDLLDIRYNILDNFNAGVKFGGAFMLRDVSEINESMTMGEATMHISSNFMLVGDYYFNKGTSAFAPFIGGGIGSFSIFDIYMQVQEGEEYNYTYDELPAVSSTLGGALRAGFELGKFRVALEYYLLPQTDKYDVANIMQSAGKSNNSYLSLNMGFYFGGGKWRK